MFDPNEAIEEIIGRINKERFEAVCDEIDLRLNNGDLTMEDAREVCDYAKVVYLDEEPVEEAAKQLSPAAKQAEIKLRKLKQKYTSVKDKPEGAQMLAEMNALQQVVMHG